MPPPLADTKPSDRLLWSVLVASAVVIVVTVLSTQLADPAPPLPRGAGPSLPRMRPPPQSAGDLLRTLGIGSLVWYVCVLSAPLFLWLSRRLPIEGRRWPGRLAAHLAVVLLLVLATGVAQYWLSYRGARMAPPMTMFLEVWMLTGSLPFLAAAAAAHALEARARARDRELEAARARSQLAEARLGALTAQLQPHFLFNTLQGIATLIGRDPDGAQRMLADLSDLLREVLRRGETREVELAEETRVLEPYLAIARRRFGQRLTVTIDVTDDARRALVPFFVLQPLVENAIHHGVESRAGAGTIGVRAWRDGDWLRLAVSDDGPGVDARPNGRRGIGLANTRARLDELYAGRYELELSRDDAGGSVVRVALPFRAA